MRAALAGAVAALAVSAAPAAQAAPAHSHTSTSGTSRPAKRAQTDAEASVKAQSTGEAVPIDADTTPTDTLTANPDGSFTLDQYVEPVRKRVAGAWKPLDATLVRGSDGTISPAVTTSQLTLSGGGSGPLAVMKTGNRSLTLTLPVALPAPTLSGDTATYADVIPGVDLKIITDDQGGFSNVLVVKNASAAADPELADLTKFSTQTSGVTLAADAAGNITATDAIGRTDFAAPAPLMWDSATPAAATPSSARVAEPSLGSSEEGDSGEPVDSSASGPGVAAHVAPVDSDYSNGSITLTPDPSLLTGSSTVYPLYIDPPYSAGGGTLQAWTYVNSYYSGTSFWKTTDDAGLRVGYQGWDAPYYVGRTFAQMSVDSRLYGAKIDDSHFYATEIYSASCTATPVQLWTTGAISSSTTWDQQPTWSSEIDSQTVAHGWSPDCPTASVGFETKSAMQNIADNSKSSITLGLKAGDESDNLGWKKFDHATMHMSTTYDRAPAKPSSLRTSPVTNCTGTTSTVGNGDVTLYATVSDPDGGTLSETYKAWETNSPSITVASGTLSATSGTASPLFIARSTLDNKASGSVLKISWNVTVSDGYMSGPVSTTCTFNFDPTAPGKPIVTNTAGGDCSSSSVQYTVGTPATFHIAPNPTGATPSSYLYQLNGAAPHQTSQTSFPITPTRGTDVITVVAQSAAGNIGDPAVCIVTAAAPATAADGDLTGDGIADLLTVGHQNTLPPGLWLARGQAGTGHSSGDGQILASAANIGTSGTGVDTQGTASDWNGSQAITGHFATGAGFNDVLQYNPTTGAAHILFNSGDGSTLTPISGAEVNVAPDRFTDPDTGAHAAQVANGGSLYNTANGYPSTGFPDLILTLEGHLFLEQSYAAPGDYAGWDNLTDLSDTNPTGTGDWTGWTITTSLIDGLPAMFAASPDGNSMYYYTPDDLENMAIGGSATPVNTNSGWGETPVLQAADINTDGTPDLWSIDSDTGWTYATYFDGNAFQNGSQPGQHITADSHNWKLSDATSGSATTAADNATTPLTLTGGGSGARWDDGDLFNPHLNLDATSTAYLTSNAALTTSANFTVSVWAKPTALGGVLVSQDGAHTSGFLIWPSSADNTWVFCLAQADSTTAPMRDCARGGSVHLGAWTHITATYNATTQRMGLYLDGIEANEGTHAPASGFTGHFTVGRQLYQGIYQSNFNGAVANTEVWAGTTLTPDQVANLSGTPGYVLFPSDDTNYASGTTWKTEGATMTFNAGQLTITETGTCTTNCTWTAGSTGHPNAVLTFQTDGNLVIYPQAAHTLGTALWATGITTPDSTLFLQPDGNLVTYDADGTVRWASGTVN